ncbi:DUF835 domain-containing protein [Candidatus Woesearchaeota archaeon]|nr:DUF835 domain-containing protein [Candidatus Woesearchaeota archaeon]
MASLLSFFPVAEALLSLGISGVLFRRWWVTNDKSTRFWAWAFLFHFMSYLIAGFFVSRLVVLQILPYFLLQFARQTLESLLFLSVYFGVINLLTTKRSLTFTLPFVFFGLQELILLYFDFFVRNLRLADQLHIVFFDIPFNVLVALLFWKYYQVSKKRYAALLSLGWLLYTVFVPIFFYTEGNVLLYTISLSHMVIMFAGFVLLYESPTGQALLEVTPAVEKRLSTAMKYQLKPGKTYLLEDVEKGYDIFMDAVLHGIRGMIITRDRPETIQKKYELQVTPVLWLTHVQAAMTTVDPSELEQLGFLLEKFMTSAQQQATEEGALTPVPEAKPEEGMIEKQVEKGEERRSVVEEKAVPEEKPEESWKQKMRETIAEVKEISKKPVVFGEEIAKKPLKELVKDVEKAGVAVTVKRGGMLVLDEEPTEKKEEPPAREATEEPVKAEEKKEEPKAEQPKEPQKQDLSEKPLKELVKDVQATGVAAEISSKPSDARKVVVELGEKVEEKKEPPKRGKMLILDDDTKDNKTKASFVLATGDIGITGLNKSIILIDGIEYLISNNTFPGVLHLLQMMKDKISLGESILLLPLDPRCFSEQEINLLRQEFETYVAEKV